MGLVDGFPAPAAYYESQPGAPGAICFREDGMSIGQSVELVVLYLVGHPEQLHDSSSVLIFGAFLDNYPCEL